MTKGNALVGRTLDPLVTLSISEQHSARLTTCRANPAAVTGLCFLNHGFNNLTDNEEHSGDSDSSSDDEGEFLCARMLQGEKSSNVDPTASARAAAASVQLLQHRLLASCHVSGDAYLWDLGTRRIVNQFGSARGPGMALRRVGSDNIMYHARDEEGTVSIHVPSQRSSLVLQQWQTHSRTFCTATSCEGSDHLLVLPSDHECYATVRDVRVAPDAHPVARVHGTGDSTNERKHGMLSSLAMCMSESHRPVLACGMESGSMFFHDLGVTSRVCGLQVSPRKDPILSMDVTSSSSGVVGIAGLGADAADLMDIPEGDRGTVAVVKVTTSEEGVMSARLRARVGTCDLKSGGKPGVSVARFRPDGRLFAIGGWDHRLRLFERTKASPMAILKGHSTSVSVIDWALDSVMSGLLATGASDAKILIWRCFSP